MYFGDGREERLDAMMLETRLRRDPRIAERRNRYYRSLKVAKQAAMKMTTEQMVTELLEAHPAYIQEKLETEDERFGPGALADRYAAVFRKRFEE